jgi:hypothetical protein
MVVDAVILEPVSPSEFPDNSENNSDQRRSTAVAPGLKGPKRAIIRAKAANRILDPVIYRIRNREFFIGEQGI